MTTALRRSLAAAALALAGASVLAACDADTPADFDTPPETTSAPAAETGEPKESAAEPADTATDGRDTDPAERIVGPEDALDTVVYALPGADERDDATVTVGLHSLRVEGEAMRLELSFTPDFQGDGSYNIYSLNNQNRLAPVLNDRVNLKQYTLLRDGTEEWATNTTNSGLRAASGETLRYWAYFAAPEDDIDTLSVGVGMVEFDDVAIER
ncbi:hypothetical protein M3148_06955 [Georgenia satyanarayanai]|uniref:hypothetical protein n=1 Tax=Georgenia satyanarayanai TaxID=860221 RepID=UPI002040F4B9|nr:hypothetical protein [Georgenia satyanarayanai]MCM3660733.1 hypothetical protein [Georgenia satyanarayanai]